MRAPNLYKNNAIVFLVSNKSIVFLLALYFSWLDALVKKQIPKEKGSI